MKESRRHRWVPLEKTRADINEARFAVCRDCGLEVATHRIKSGDLGPCAGKASEGQRGLSLISGDPQSIGNEIMTNALMACAGCGKPPDMMIAHRNPAGEITGWLFTCGLCFLHMRDHEVIIRPVVKETADEQ